MDDDLKYYHHLGTLPPWHLGEERGQDRVVARQQVRRDERRLVVDL